MDMDLNGLSWLFLVPFRKFLFLSNVFLVSWFKGMKLFSYTSWEGKGKEAKGIGRRATLSICTLSSSTGYFSLSIVLTSSSNHLTIFTSSLPVF